MGIDLKTETPIKLRKLPEWLAAMGLEYSERSAYAWHEKGILETGLMGGVLHTSEEAVQRMFDRENAPAETPASARRQAEAAGKRLEASGW